MKFSHLKKKLNPAPLFSLLFALIVGALIIAVSGNSPFTIYAKLAFGAFGSKSSFLNTLLQATPLLFCGLSVCTSMKGGLLNLGVEGQLYMGALASTLAGLYLNGLPAFIHVPVCIAAGILGGAIWSFLPVWLKIKRGAHEVVTALMLNYIAILFIDYMVNYPLKDTDSSVAQTALLPATATLPKLFERSQVTAAILIGIVMAILLTVILKYTILGFQITLTGHASEAAQASGIKVNRISIITMMIAGGLSGLAGAMEVMGTYTRLIQGFSPGYGFDGIAVAVLGSTPVSVIFSALLFGGLRAGGMALSFGTNLSVKFITTLQAIIILLIAAPELPKNLLQTFSRFWRRLTKKEG